MVSLGRRTSAGVQWYQWFAVLPASGCSLDPGFAQLYNQPRPAEAHRHENLHRFCRSRSTFRSCEEDPEVTASAHSAVSVVRPAPRVLVIYKKSAYQIYVRERRHSHIEQLLAARDTGALRLLRAHN